MTDLSIDSKVDPAALLLAVLAVVVAPLVSEGPWGWINTAIAAVVLLIIYGFGLHDRRIAHWSAIAATAAVVGTLVWVGFAWPAQVAFAKDCPIATAVPREGRLALEVLVEQMTIDDQHDRCEAEQGETGSVGALAPGVVAAAFTCAGLRRRARHAAAQPPPPDAPTFMYVEHAEVEIEIEGRQRGD